MFFPAEIPVRSTGDENTELIPITEGNIELVAGLLNNERYTDPAFFPSRQLYRIPRIGVAIEQKGYYENIKTLHEFYRDEPIIGQFVDKMIDGSFQWSSFQTTDNYTNILNIWAAKLNVASNKTGGLDIYNRKFLKTLLLDGMVVTCLFWSGMTHRDDKRLNATRVPVVMEILSNEAIVPSVDDLGRWQYWYRLTNSQAEDLKNDKYGVFKNLYDNVNEIKVERPFEDYWGTQWSDAHIKLPSNNIIVTELDKPDFYQFPDPPLLRMFPALSSVRTQRTGDYSIAQSIINQILVVKFPNTVDKPKRQEFINSLHAGGRAQIAGVPTGIEFDVIQSDTATLLDEKKYIQPNKDMYSSIGFNIDFVNSRDLALFDIEMFRNHLLTLQKYTKRNIESVLMKIWKLNDWDLPYGNIELNPVGLRSDAYRALAFQQWTTRALDTKTLHEISNFDHDTVMKRLDSEGGDAYDSKYPVRPSFAQRSINPNTPSLKVSQTPTIQPPENVPTKGIKEPTSAEILSLIAELDGEIIGE